MKGRTGSDSVSSSESADYRHNIKMLTGVEDVRKATLFGHVHFPDAAEADFDAKQTKDSPKDVPKEAAPKDTSKEGENKEPEAIDTKFQKEKGQQLQTSKTDGA